MCSTQGTFSFLLDLADAQIEAQMRYCLNNGWAINLQHTDGPHPRNTYREMPGTPIFDLKDPADQLAECRTVFGDRYIRLTPFDAGHGCESDRRSFIINRSAEEPGFALERTEAGDRQMA